MKPLIAKLVWPAYLGGVIFLSYIGFNSYVDASFILKDHTVVEAPIELVRTSSRTKRGHTSITYHFNYTYNVNGTDYVTDYSAVNEHGERYLDNGYITIAHSNSDPSRAGALHVLEGQSTMGGLVKRIFFAALILGLVALFVYGWASPDEEEDEELPEGAKT